MLQYPWLDEYLLGKPGIVKDFKEEWGWHRYMVGGKLFAAIMHPSDTHSEVYANKDLINLKCDPLLAELLRAQHAEVLPGFYSDKRHWNSIELNGKFPAEVLRSLVDDSYQLVFEKLTKKLQREILQNFSQAQTTL